MSAVCSCSLANTLEVLDVEKLEGVKSRRITEDVESDLGHNAKIISTASQGPEEICVDTLAGSHCGAIC
jgi:hypothetical protein